MFIKVTQTKTKDTPEHLLFLKPGKITYFEEVVLKKQVEAGSKTYIFYESYSCQTEKYVSHFYVNEIAEEIQAAIDACTAKSK